MRTFRFNDKISLSFASLNPPLINMKNCEGNTPLIRAVLIGDYEIVEKLIKGGARINSKNKNGGSALYYASMLNYQNLIELLIINGATSPHLGCLTKKQTSNIRNFF